MENSWKILFFNYINNHNKRNQNFEITLNVDKDFDLIEIDMLNLNENKSETILLLNDINLDKKMKSILRIIVLKMLFL